MSLSRAQFSVDQTRAGLCDAAGMRPAHILVVDDNEINQRVARCCVELLGFTCEVVAGGQQAVEAVRDGRFDLVLMDIRMPLMDGVSATRAIRALPQDPAQIPIIAVTANASPGECAAYLAAGMCGVVEKPIAFPVLFDAIKRALAPA